MLFTPKIRLKRQKKMINNNNNYIIIKKLICSYLEYRQQSVESKKTPGIEDLWSRKEKF